MRQTQQGPSSSNYDTVASSYDGRSRQNFQTLPYQGTLGQITLANYGVTTTYDALDRASQTTDAGSGFVSYTYSGNDTLVTIGPNPTGENLKKRNMEYNGAGWLTSVCEVTSGTTAWPGGACGQTASNAGYLTKYSYNPAGLLTLVKQNAQSASVQTRSLSYDALGRKISETIPEWSAGTSTPGTTTYAYDSDPNGYCSGTFTGDLVKQVDNMGNTTCFSYDKLHRRLSSQVVAGGSGSPYLSVTPKSYFVYDAATYGSTAMQNVKGALAEAYTCSGACSSKLTDVFISATPVTSGTAQGGMTAQMWESTPHSGGYFLTQDTYFPNGTVSAISAQLGASSIGIPNLTYSVDGEGRPYSASESAHAPLVSSTAYNSASAATTITYGNSATGSASDTDSFQYDPQTLRPTNVTYSIYPSPSSGDFNISSVLTWNANASLKQMQYTDGNDATKNQTCAYAADDLSRIASVNCGTSTWAQTFTYDPFGNIQKSNGGGATSYTANYSAATNQVSSGITPLPNYDANGNQLTSTPATLTWNALNQPISVNSTTATYDALGRMVETGSGSTYKQFVFRPSGDLLAVYSSALVKGTVPLPGGSSAVYNSAGLNFIRHKDWLGSSRFATTWAHGVYAKEAYAPFGEVYNEAGTPDRSFTGQDQDIVTGSAGTGVYDFLFRKYDPSAGRWLSPDPSGWNAVDGSAPQSLNRYAYVENKPMTAVDMDGLSCVTNWVPGAGGGMVSVQVDDGDGQGCAAAGVSPASSIDPTGTNDGAVSAIIDGDNPGAPNQSPQAICDAMCQFQYAQAVSQLSGPIGGNNGGTPNNPAKPPLTPQQKHDKICETLDSISKGAAVAGDIFFTVAAGAGVITGIAAANIEAAPISEPVAAGAGIVAINAGAVGVMFKGFQYANTAYARWAIGCSNNWW